MILLLDVGNTRLKWAEVTPTGLSEQAALVHRDVDPAVWTAALVASSRKPSRILAGNVAGPSMAHTLARLCEETYGVSIEFITASTEFQGLTNGYLKPELLGVDRWLALIGAWTRTHSALCILDVGTAAKVDSVNADGQHLGGLIVPGIHMMRESLMAKTSDIAKAAQQSTASLEGILANNTLGAISRGAVFALAGMGDHAVELVKKNTGTRPKLFITGGDATLVANHLHTRGEIVPELVLQGLAAVALATQA